LKARAELGLGVLDFTNNAHNGFGKALVKAYVVEKDVNIMEPISR